MRVSMYSIFFTQLLADNVSKGKSENRGQSESNTKKMVQKAPLSEEASCTLWQSTSTRLPYFTSHH